MPNEKIYIYICNPQTDCFLKTYLFSYINSSATRMLNLCEELCIYAYVGRGWGTRRLHPIQKNKTHHQKKPKKQLIYIYCFFHGCVAFCIFFFLFLAYIYIRGSLNMFPDFFRMGTFIDCTHMKL